MGMRFLWILHMFLTKRYLPGHFASGKLLPIRMSKTTKVAGKHRQRVITSHFSGNNIALLLGSFRNRGMSRTCPFWEAAVMIIVTKEMIKSGHRIPRQIALASLVATSSSMF